jgi:hypothetical protein
MNSPTRLRLGVNIIEARSVAPGMPEPTQEALAAIFDGLAPHFRALARGRVAPLGDDLLRKIDFAIDEVVASNAATNAAVAATVGLRRTLYPEAPSHQPVQMPPTAPRVTPVDVVSVK